MFATCCRCSCRTSCCRWAVTQDLTPKPPSNRHTCQSLMVTSDSLNPFNCKGSRLLQPSLIMQPSQTQALPLSAVATALNPLCPQFAPLKALQTLCNVICYHPQSRKSPPIVVLHGRVYVETSVFVQGDCTSIAWGDVQRGALHTPLFHCMLEGDLEGQGVWSEVGGFETQLCITRLQAAQCGFFTCTLTCKSAVAIPCRLACGATATFTTCAVRLFVQ